MWKLFLLLIGQVVFAPNLIFNHAVLFQAHTWLEVEGQYCNLNKFQFPTHNCFLLLLLFIIVAQEMFVTYFCCLLIFVVFRLFALFCMPAGFSCRLA